MARTKTTDTATTAKTTKTTAKAANTEEKPSTTKKTTSTKKTTAKAKADDTAKTATTSKSTTAKTTASKRTTSKTSTKSTTSKAKSSTTKATASKTKSTSKTKTTTKKTQPKKVEKELYKTLTIPSFFTLSNVEKTFKEPLVVDIYVENHPSMSVYSATVDPSLEIFESASDSDIIEDRIYRRLAGFWSWIVEADDMLLSPRSQELKYIFVDKVY